MYFKCLCVTAGGRLNGRVCSAQTLSGQTYKQIGRNSAAALLIHKRQKGSLWGNDKRFRDFQSRIYKSNLKGSNPCRAHSALSSPHLFDHLSLSSSLLSPEPFHMNRCFMYTSSKLLRGENSYTKPAPGPGGFDFRHRSVPGGGVLFSRSKQSALIPPPMERYGKG